MAGKGKVIVDRVGTTGFLQLEAKSFRDLTLREKTLAYWLTQAAIAIDPIIYDQYSIFGLRQKRILDAIMLSGNANRRIADFAKLFWANRGNHNEYTAQKFLPGFSFEEFRGAARTALGASADLDHEMEELRPSLFDPDFQKMTTAKSPQEGLDILQASANNFYSNVKMRDLEGFREGYPLNSRLVRNSDGRLEEQVWRAGTPDGKVKPGLYAEYLAKAIGFLQKAKDYATAKQRKAIAALVRYYQTGDPADWKRFNIAWVRDDSRVDFTNGFIEVLADARATKGTSQAFVCVTDEAMNRSMRKLAANARYFEDRAPWAPEYKNRRVNPPVAKAVEAVVETGGFPVSITGENLPNENEVREKFGSKNFIFTGSLRAFERAISRRILEEFSESAEEVAICRKHGDEAEALLTALHEVVGHGSGRLSPRLRGGAEPHLREYYSTLEETRADLMGLWNVWDPKLRQLGLASNPDVARAMYYASVRTTISQLRYITHGDTIEEDHLRGRQMTVGYIREKTGAVELVKRGGKSYLRLKDFGLMRKGVGMLLAELMRIKAEGDYEGIRVLVDRYGTHFDPTLRDEVLERYKKLDLPTYWCGINPTLTPRLDHSGRVKSVAMGYERDFVRQQLGYSAMYRQ